MKKSYIYCVVLFLALFFTKAHAVNNSCTSPSPSNFSQVFECISSQPTSYNGNFELTGCSQLSSQYVSILRKAGAKQSLIDQTPSCSLFAKVVEEISGTSPFWQNCVNYDGSKKHFAKCTAAFIQHSSKGKGVNANCQLISNIYLTALRFANNQPNTLDPPYTALSCDEMIDELSNSDIDVVGKECVHFTPNDISGHMTKCMSHDPQVMNNLEHLDCNKMRMFYQVKLTLTYGTMPVGYKVLSCSLLNQAIEQLRQLNQLQIETPTNLINHSSEANKISKIDDQASTASLSKVLAPPKKTLREQTRPFKYTDVVQSTPEIAQTTANTSLRPLVKIAPHYPIKAESSGLEGWVKLRFNINELGQVIDIEYVSSSQPRIFDREAKRALKKWKYQPQVIDGKPTKILGQEEVIQFKLSIPKIIGVARRQTNETP